MIYVINALIANHLIMMFVALMALVYLRSENIQQVISFKVALYSLYSCLIVGFLFILVGNPLKMITARDINSKKFIENLQAGESQVETGVSYAMDPISPIYKYVLLTILTVAAAGALYFVFCFIQLARSRSHLKVIRKMKSVKICTTNKQTIPYVFSVFRDAYIVIPEEYVSSKKHMAYIVKHEFQHIRNLDTQLILFMSFLKSILFINPAVHLAYKTFRQLHELAVDTEILRKSNRQSYLETLSWVFENSNFKTQPQLTNGFFGLSHLKEYKMRIFNIKNTSQKKNNLFAIAAMVCLGMVGVSCVSHLSKDKMAVNSLESDSSNKEYYSIKFNMTDSKGKTSKMSVITGRNEESVMVNSDNPKWLEKLDMKDMNIPNDMGMDYKLVRFVVEESKDGWVKFRVKGKIVENKNAKEFEITNKIALNETFEIPTLDGNITITRK